MDLQKFTEKTIPKLTEAQESFVVSRFIAGESVQRIARDFLEFFPHFNGAVDKAKCEQVIRARCCHWKDPKTPQYKIIWKAILYRSDDTTDILFTHQRYRDDTCVKISCMKSKILIDQHQRQKGKQNS